jgi:hypothetical protein
MQRSMQRLSRRFARRRLMVEPAAADVPAYPEFVCAACRRELPVADRSRIAPARCRACA